VMNCARPIIFTLGVALALGLAIDSAPFSSASAAPKNPSEEGARGPSEEGARGAAASRKIPSAELTYKTYSVRPPNTKVIAPKVKPRVCPDGKRYVWICEMTCDMRGCRPTRCYPSVECY